MLRSGRGIDITWRPSDCGNFSAIAGYEESSAFALTFKQNYFSWVEIWENIETRQ